MHKLKILFFLFFVFFFAQITNAQVVIEGKQVKKTQNIQFEGKAVFVPVQSKIVSVEGSNTSFSLRIDNFTKYQFYFNTDHYEPPTYSVIIEPGMYELFPDLPSDIDSVIVRIKLEPIE